jgi:hypothetical protein
MSRIIKPENLVLSLAQPRTLAEIAKELDRKVLTEAQLRGMALPPGYVIFEQRSPSGVPVFLALAPPPVTAEQPRDWSIWQNPKGQPYIWIQFHNRDLKRIRLIPVSDVHYGARAHSRQRFQEYVNWIRDTPDVYCFLNGDIIENAIDGAIGGAVYESCMTPDEQIWGTHDKREPGMIEILRPIAHKILWALPGNHEWRTWKAANLDPLRVICSELKIPYYNEPIFADVLAWGHRFPFYCQHGASGSGTKGGKLNAAGRPAEFQEHIAFVIMGHVHDSMANDVTRIVRRRTFDAQGRLTGFRLEERSQYTVIAPSFMQYFGTYGTRAGYAPGSWGTVSCTLHDDGSYRVSE